MRFLVTGATGYIGGRLVGRLLGRGHQVRVLVREPSRITGREWAPKVEVVQGDLLRPESLEGAADGVDGAFYLVHSMASGEDFASQDRAAANAFVEAVRGLRHLVYLGGILPDTGEGGVIHSAHLASRVEVGSILRARLPTTELRAGPIIGSGSASFEMVRYLTERLPVMTAPRWILNPVRPIAVRDILAYLCLAGERGEALGVMDVGTDPLTFKDMMMEYARVRGLRRVILPVPVLAPRLAGLWVGVVTPIPNAMALPLVEGVLQPVVGDTTRARALFPEVEPLSYRAAVELALTRIREGRVATRWSGALGRGATNRFEDREGVAREERTRFVNAPAEAVFRSFSTLGGERGWLVWRWAWELRGFLDALVGGPGLRRGRRDPLEILPGEALDFWRVEEVRPPHLLRLRAEMRLPGKAWLQFEAVPENGGTRLVQTALFAPRGMWGALYWYGSFPFHRFIFSAMVDALARDALRYARDEAGPAPAGPSSDEPVVPGDPGHPTSPQGPRTV
jgi:uncharacterized protein YbjT (DUF2867 family)